MDLQERYDFILNNLGFSELERVSLWNDLVKLYSQNFRKYHNLEHLKQMFALYDKFKNEIENPIELELAIFYHDIIYKVSKQDNEEKSAVYAKNIFKTNIIDVNLIEKLILSTKTHIALSNDEKWMVDFDLSVLGLSWDLYSEYFNKIRKEYRIYPNLMYNPGRKNVLLHFLEKDRIFQTEIFYKKYEETARENLKTEIELL